MALGADEGRVLRLVLRQGLILAAIGVAIGVVLAGIGSTLVESLLYGVRGLDPVTFLGASLLFGVVTLAATYIPARRAVRINPVAALQAQKSQGSGIWDRQDQGSGKSAQGSWLKAQARSSSK